MESSTVAAHSAARTSATIDALRARFSAEQLETDPQRLSGLAVDEGPLERWTVQPPLAALRPGRVDDVQALMRLSAELGFPVITRGAGTGVSGGANTLSGSVLLDMSAMDRILTVSPEDETAVVEPGVLNAALNEAVAAHGLMYAPDPASYRISTIGGNVATNAGGLRCAKYGVTRDSILALDVVLADGTLIRTGQRTFKGVAGYDLTGLLVGSEGTLGVIVGITVRLRYLPVRTCTIAAFFDDLPLAAAGVQRIGAARIQPAIMELLDAGIMAALDRVHGSRLGERGSAMLLLQTDGFGADDEAEVIRAELTAMGAAVSEADDEEADRLVELRRHARGDGISAEVRVGEDVAVPRSALVGYIHRLQEIAAAHAVAVKVVAHAGDGNLHPAFSVWMPDEPDEPAALARLQEALDESVAAALEAGGTITGEHGVGTYKLRWLGWEQSDPVRELQLGIKRLFDPEHRLNPGRAVA